MATCNWNLLLGAGVRYFDFDSISYFSSIDHSHNNGVGPEITAELTRRLNDRWALYLITRDSIIAADNNYFGSNGSPEQTNNVSTNVFEMQAAVIPSLTCIRIDCVLSLEDNILTALRRISQAIDVWSRELWHDFGLTAPQLATLREIIAGDNATPVTLASALHLSQPTVTGILHRLEQRGLIKRKRSTVDRRSVLAVVTSRGRRLANECLHYSATDSGKN